MPIYLIYGILFVCVAHKSSKSTYWFGMVHLKAKAIVGKLILSGRDYFNDGFICEGAFDAHIQSSL